MNMVKSIRGLGRLTLACSLLLAMASLALCQSDCADCSKQKSTVAKVEGWATVPNGSQVWLRPGLDAYEHDTGLVRDLQTGRKSMPITPDSNVNWRPLVAPVQPVPPPPPPPPRSPYAPYYAPYSPYVLPQVAPPAYQPYYHGGGYDYGPNHVYGQNVYSNQPCNGCGAKLGSPGSINSRWTRVQ